jgi:hypothetical protein
MAAAAADSAIARREPDLGVTSLAATKPVAAEAGRPERKAVQVVLAARDSRTPRFAPLPKANRPLLLRRIRWLLPIRTLAAQTHPRRRFL